MYFCGIGLCYVVLVDENAISTRFSIYIIFLTYNIILLPFFIILLESLFIDLILFIDLTLLHLTFFNRKITQRWFLPGHPALRIR